MIYLRCNELVIFTHQFLVIENENRVVVIKDSDKKNQILLMIKMLFVNI